MGGRGFTDLLGRIDLLGRAQHAAAEGRVDKAARLINEARSIEHDEGWNARTRGVVAEIRSQLEGTALEEFDSLVGCSDRWHADGDDAPLTEAGVSRTQSASSALRPESRQALFYWGVISAGLMVIGAFGPWLTTPLGMSESGMDGSNDGWGVLIAALFAGGVLLFARRYREAGVASLLGGIAGAAITIHDRTDVTRGLAKDGAFAQAIIHVGWGLNLAMIASISLVISAIVWILKVETTPER